MGFYKQASLVFIAILLSVLEVTSLQCYQCTNCTTSNMVKVTCDTTNVTIPITTDPPVTGNETVVNTESPVGENETVVNPGGNETVVNPPSTGNATGESSTGNETVVNPGEPSTGNETSVDPGEQSTGNETAVNPETALRVRRSFNIDNIEDEEGCFCEDGMCLCNSGSLRTTNVTFVCVTDTRKVGTVSLVNKGCAIRSNTTTNSCLLSGYSVNCKTCTGDLCNAAISWKFSSILLLSVFYVPFI